MVLMESYFFCASVRLGVLVISAFALLKSVMIIYIVSTNGLRFMLNVISYFEINASYRASYYLVRDTIYWLEQYPQAVSVFLQLYSIGHVMSCAFAAYGAYMIKQRFVIPLAVFEFIYIVETATLFTLFLRILRHFLSITHLTLLTITATFYCMLVAYDFLAIVAFEQIVRLVKSKRYQEIYGTDPLNPIITPKQKIFISTEEQNLDHPIIVYVMPFKWWQMEALDRKSFKETPQADDSHKYFQSQELVPEIMLHNATNIRKNQKYKY
ncbi:LOW QUALITY PROTEIN: uncharacterized protein LOC117563724 [Drosophila albomicans]|uniref:LOW QUALITY PROTEIN: uncharacterized protein LOC117563724 n=1 Tax=Drosophila albomicans TaxID=7291 RepID=A0A6P8XFM5_DROAB|nr:LOW QUALITY PROTEIN: uncharacterized protein LOC117563724 [Drosophila albomicans]